jgi:hypothetical protein
MRRRRFLQSAALAALPSWTACGTGADLSPDGHAETVRKGFDWLVRQQQRDGHWEANGGAYPGAMTALGGLALLMEGSTLREGKYTQRLRRAVDWLLERSQRSGLIANTANQMEAARYMFGHGFATLFLSQVFGEEEDMDRRRTLEEVLVRAVRFIGNAQSTLGGWYYTSAADGHDSDEGSVTVTQMQALRGARNAGIPVPKSIIDKGLKYLEKSTNSSGGVIYSLSQAGGRAIGEGRPALTAAAIACGFSAGEYSSPLIKRWIAYCKNQLPTFGANRFGHDEYTLYYYAQAMYILGDDRYGRLFPNVPASEWLTWSRYRKQLFDHLAHTQASNGSWDGGYVGPVFATAAYLAILQLDKSILPFYQR